MTRAGNDKLTARTAAMTDVGGQGSKLSFPVFLGSRG